MKPLPDGVPLRAREGAKQAVEYVNDWIETQAKDGARNISMHPDIEQDPQWVQLQERLAQLPNPVPDNAKVTVNCPLCQSEIVTLRAERTLGVAAPSQAGSYGLTVVPVVPGSTMAANGQDHSDLGSWSQLRNVLVCPLESCNYERKATALQSLQWLLLAHVQGTDRVPANISDQLTG